MKEERDINGDGVVDLWSYYENDRVVRQDVSAVGLELLSKQQQLPSSPADPKQEENRIKDDRTLSETTKEALIRARVGQGLFRQNVEARESACRVTGITDKRFLIASHIKPWRVSSNEERLDGANGLLLSPHIDKLFDQRWISFADDGDLLVSPDCPADVIAEWDLRIPIAKRPFSTEQRAYLAYHRQHIFSRAAGEAI